MKKNYKELLPESLNSYKVNLHCHSDVSDSLTRTFEVKDIYKKALLFTFLNLLNF